MDPTTHFPNYIPGTQHGLLPPKMAVQFDGYYNNSQFGYCKDAYTLLPGSRFDPAFPGTTSGGKDTVQYVFWGSRNPLAAPCRNNAFYNAPDSALRNSPLYDDNRHNPKETSVASQWTYSPVGTQEITQRVKVGPDGTIYAVYGIYPSPSALLALDPSSGALKWQFPAPAPTTTGDPDLDSLAVGSSGNIFVGSDDNKVFARKPDGSQLSGAPHSERPGRIAHRHIRVAEPDLFRDRSSGYPLCREQDDRQSHLGVYQV